MDFARALDVGRGTVDDWLRWYAREGIDGLRTAKPGRSLPELTTVRRDEPSAIVDAGPLAAGSETAMWTGKSIAAVIEARFSARCHPRSVPRPLHAMGSSEQRPRKRLARADAVEQATSSRERFPALKKRPRTAGA